MFNRVVAVACALLVGVSIVSGQAPVPAAQVSPAARWQRAIDAWEAGSYPAAIDDLRALLRSPSADEYFERVALLTGELYVTTTITTAGDVPRLAANGAFASYQTGADGTPTTSIIRLDPKPEKIADLRTSAVAFEPNGKRLAWLRYVTTGDPTASELVVRDLSTAQETVWLGTGLSKSDLRWAGDSVLFLGGTA